MLTWLRNALWPAAARPADPRARAAREAWQRGDMPRAETLYREILDAGSDHAEALAGLGEIAVALGKNADAAGLLERAISLDDSQPRFHYAFGCALQGLGEADEAMSAYARALAADPSNTGAHTNLGSLLQERAERGAESDLDEAVRHFRRVCELAPGSAAAWLNLGYAMDRQRRLGEALECYDRALAIDPALAEAHFNKALVLLARGELAAGWREYEWRWPASGFPRPMFDRPEWDGAPLGTGTLLLYTEQGFGDAIQFLRYVRPARERAAKIVLRSTPELRRLFAATPEVSSSIVDGEPLPPFDAHCPLLSLPRILGETGIRSPGRYLCADALTTEHWRDIVPRGKELNVGLVWASQPMARIAPLKSIAFSALAPLLDVPGVRFYSLQKGEAGMEATAATSRIVDLANRLGDFADTAAAIEQMDLVICVDTAVAHLAGALAKPVWTLLPYVPDWRWQPDAASSAWYPTMRLYKQNRRGNWGELVATMATDLAALARERGALNRT